MNPRRQYTMGALTITPTKPVIPAILTMIQQEYPGYHPLMAIAKMAHESNDDKVQLRCHETLAKYVAPELKSIEIRPPRDNRTVFVSLFDVVDEAEICPSN
jgi:hypothetical protein